MCTQIIGRWLAGLSAAGLFVLAQPALAQQLVVGLSTGSPVKAARSSNAVAGCPNAGGLINSVSVPVNQSIPVAVQIGSPLTYSVSFQLRSRNPAYVAAGDRLQGFLPVVTVPAGQLVSNTFDLFGVGVGSTTLDIVPLSAGFSNSSVPAGAWDINRAGGGSSKFVDANPPSGSCRAAGTASMATSANVLSSCGSTIDGVAADGATQLLLRTLSGLPGTACFEVTSSSALDQGTVATPLTTTQAVSGLNYAFSLMKAPATYGDNSDSRKVKVTFTFTPSVGNSNTTTIDSELTVLRPPVVLMHGLWSKPSAWDASFFRNDAAHTITKGDYESTNAAHFGTNVPAVKRAVENAIRQFRATRNAVTQVDIVGHSMGGILSRLYANGSDNLRPDNYNLGDIRRLITVDTPHWGSTLANLLVSLRQVAPRRVDTIGGVIGSVRNGAVCDLAENSPALAGLGSTSVPGSTISGLGGTFPAYGDTIESALTARICTSWSFNPLACTGYSYLFPQNRVDGFRFQGTNDEIVGLTDQKGGVGGWSFASLVHTNVNKTPAVAAKVFELLDGPASGLAATAFPAAQSTRLGNPAAPPRGVTGLGAATDSADYAAQCGTGGPMNPAAARAPNPAVRSASGISAQVVITSPAPQQRFAPGETITVNVDVDGAVGATGVLVGMPPVPLAGTTRLDATNFRLVQALPADYAGPLTITPIAVDAALNEIEGVAVTINVVPNVAPTSAAFAQRYFYLEPGPAAQQLTLIGSYGSDSPQIDLSRAVTGTLYSSSNPAVASVSADGLVAIVGAGTAVISGSNGPARDQAVFVVESASTPPLPQNVSASFSVQRGGFRLDRNTGFYLQSVVLTNSSAAPVPGSAFLVLSGLSSGVQLINKSGATAAAVAGSPYVTLPLSSDGRTVAPGQSTTLTLQFLNPNRVSIGYTPSVYRSSNAP